MMTRFRDFGYGAEDSAEPISFKLHGEEFHCVKNVQGKMMLQLVADSTSNDPAKSSAMIEEFFAAVLLDESAERFTAMLEGKDKIVSVETLAEITGWLVEQYTSRPESQPED
jgi:hypothetical protein